MWYFCLDLYNHRFSLLLFQIATLKAALAKKEGEPENIQSTQSSPDMYRIKRGNAIPAFPKNRQPMEEVGNLEVLTALSHKINSFSWKSQKYFLFTLNFFVSASYDSNQCQIGK